MSSWRNILYRTFYSQGNVSRFLKRIYYSLFWKRKENDFIILCSMRKSGTTWFRIFLTNYIYNYYGKGGRATYEKVEEMFPNDCHLYKIMKKKYKIPTNLMRKTPYKDFVYSHNPEFLEFTKGKVVCLYRNPLDTAISLYYSKYKYRPEKEDEISEPAEILEDFLYGKGGYIYHYNLISRLAEEKPNILPVAYEWLWKEPETTFAIIISWLGLPLDYNCLNKAIEYSSFKEVRKEEKKKGRAIHAPKNYKGYFTRKGEIGQWKDQFTKKKTNWVKKQLEKNGISEKEFIFE